MRALLVHMAYLNVWRRADTFSMENTFVERERLDANNCAVLLVDYQTGLVQLVRDYDEHTFRNNVLALADLAKAYKLPTILTTSTDGGPNGPLVPEIKAKFPDAPYIRRPGQINAWDNEDFVSAVKV
jgi:nicotinamidase-related amidase